MFACFSQTSSSKRIRVKVPELCKLGVLCPFVFVFFWNRRPTRSL